MCFLIVVFSEVASRHAFWWPQRKFDFDGATTYFHSLDRARWTPPVTSCALLASGFGSVGCAAIAIHFFLNFIGYSKDCTGVVSHKGLRCWEHASSSDQWDLHKKRLRVLLCGRCGPIVLDVAKTPDDVAFHAFDDVERVFAKRAYEILQGPPQGPTAQLALTGLPWVEFVKTETQGGVDPAQAVVEPAKADFESASAAPSLSLPNSAGGPPSMTADHMNSLLCCHRSTIA